MSSQPRFIFGIGEIHFSLALGVSWVSDPNYLKISPGILGAEEMSYETVVDTKSVLLRLVLATCIFFS
jgi:hypothetical protein